MWLYLTIGAAILALTVFQEQCSAELRAQNSRMKMKGRSALYRWTVLFAAHVVAIVIWPVVVLSVIIQTRSE